MMVGDLLLSGVFHNKGDLTLPFIKFMSGLPSLRYNSLWPYRCFSAVGYEKSVAVIVEGTQNTPPIDSTSYSRKATMIMARRCTERGNHTITCLRLANLKLCRTSTLVVWEIEYFRLLLALAYINHETKEKNRMYISSAESMTHFHKYITPERPQRVLGVLSKPPLQ